MPLSTLIDFLFEKRCVRSSVKAVFNLSKWFKSYIEKSFLSKNW